jgi:hypothetical protein
MNKWGLKIGQIWFKSHWPQKIITKGLDELLQKDADSNRITVARSYHVQKS